MAKRNYLKRAGFLLMALLVASSVLAGCAQNTDQSQTNESPGASNPSSPNQGSSGNNEATGTAANVNPPGVFPICKEPITIKVGTPQNSNVENYETNKLTLWYQEKGNFTLEFIYFPTNSAEAQQKLDVMIASGSELPEVLIGFAGTISEETLLRYGMEGVAIPLNDYYDNWAFHINEAFEQLNNKDMKKWLTSADGNIYYIPKGNEQIGNMYSLRSFINKNWLDNLGLAIPTTTAEFKDVMLQCLNGDANGNGLKDEVGFVGNPNGWRANPSDFFMNAFIYNDANNRLIPVNGQLIPAYTQPEWREGLRYLNDLVQNGIILPQAFTMDDDQIRQMCESGDDSIVGGMVGSFAAAFGATNERKLEYSPIPPLTGPNGVGYAAFFPDNPQRNFIITKDAKNPEAIFRLGDLMCSEEGYMRTRWGEPEVDWIKPGPNDTSPLESIGIKPSIIPILPWGSLNNAHWSFSTAGMIPLGVADGQVPPADDPLYVERWTAAAVLLYVGKEPDNRADLFKYTLDEAEQMIELRGTINSYVKESMALFAVGDRDIENDWDKYLKELENMGLSKYLELSQAGYDRAKG